MMRRSFAPRLVSHQSRPWHGNTAGCLRPCGPHYLPPEFMLTPEQVSILRSSDIELTFINASRYSQAQQARIPTVPYAMHGPLGTRLAAFPSRAHSRGLTWRRSIPWCNHGTMRSSRPSSKRCTPGAMARRRLFPDGLERECRWLDTGRAWKRCTWMLRVWGLFPMPRPLDAAAFARIGPFPVRVDEEFRMMGYVRRVWELEERVEQLDHVQTALWLQCINSDVLSSVEKDSVPKRYATLDDPGLSFDSVLHRSERGFEGWEYLLLLERIVGGDADPYLDSSNLPHGELRGRIRYLQRHFNGRRVLQLLAARAARIDDDARLDHQSRYRSRCLRRDGGRAPSGLRHVASTV